MEYVTSTIVGLLGLMMIWIGLFGGEISYSSKGAFPQFAEHMKRRKAQKQAEREVQHMVAHMNDSQVERNRLFRHLH